MTKKHSEQYQFGNFRTVYWSIILWGFVILNIKLIWLLCIWTERMSLIKNHKDFQSEENFSDWKSFLFPSTRREEKRNKSTLKIWENFYSCSINSKWTMTDLSEFLKKIWFNDFFRNFTFSLLESRRSHFCNDKSLYS